VGRDKGEEILAANPRLFQPVREVAEEEGRPLQQRFWTEGRQQNFYKVTHLDFPWPLGNRWLLTRRERPVMRLSANLRRGIM